MVNPHKSIEDMGLLLKNSQDKLQSIESKQTQQCNMAVDDLNNCMRRNNLIFKGIPEASSETWQDTEVLVKEFVIKNLGLPAGEVERAHRLGEHNEDCVRPINVKFLNVKDKTNILTNAFKLEHLEQRVWIQEDISPRVQQIRKKLRDFARENKKPQDMYKLLFDKRKPCTALIHRAIRFVLYQSLIAVLQRTDLEQ